VRPRRQCRSISFITETIAAFATDADEILVEGAKAFRSNAGPNEHALVHNFNEYVTARFRGERCCLGGSVRNRSIA
jgi:hypothetical protein